MEFGLFTPFTLSSDSGDYRYDFSWHTPGVGWSDSLIECLLTLLQTHSIDYSRSCAYWVGRFVREVLLLRDETAAPLLLEHFSDWIERFGTSSWAFMQAVLAHWRESKLPGLDRDIASFLEQPSKWEEKGKGNYFALIANDPKRGAFTEQELNNIHEAVNRAYENGRVTTREWALTWFLIGTGVRPVQVARTRLKDIIVTPGPEGCEITLAIPLAKQRTADRTARWKRKCPTQLCEVLLKYLSSGEMSARTPEEPLFFDQSEKVRACLQKVFEAVGTHSERLNGPIPIFPYRFRYTLGTRAIAHGASDHVAARLLTHKTTHCIQFYRASMPALQQPLKEALGGEMSYFAKAFQGRLIDSLEEASRAGDESALIYDFANLLGQQLGACGTLAKCHQDAPRACVTCAKFEPFKNAPWEDLLKSLKADQQTEREDRIKLITQKQIDAVRQIMAERDASLGGVQ